MEAAIKLFGISILNSEFVNTTENGMQFNDVVFFNESLKKYDGKCVEVFHDWKIMIWDDRRVVIDEFFIIENEEFKQKLYEAYPLK